MDTDMQKFRNADRLEKQLAAQGDVRNGQDLDQIEALLVAAGARVKRFDQYSGAKFSYNMRLFSVPDEVAAGSDLLQQVQKSQFACTMSINEKDTAYKLLHCSAGRDFELMMTHENTDGSVWLYYNAK
jgi:hypothetical protein